MKIRIEGLVTIYTPQGALDNGKVGSAELSGCLSTFVVSSNMSCLINLGEVSHVGMGGVSLMQEAHIQLMKRKAVLKLCCIRPSTMRPPVFEALEAIFVDTIYATEEEALRSYDTAA